MQFNRTFPDEYLKLCFADDELVKLLKVHYISLKLKNAAVLVYKASLCRLADLDYFLMTFRFTVLLSYLEAKSQPWVVRWLSLLQKSILTG